MLLTFTKPEFESLIKDGIKKHTIRADKSNRWKVGNSIQFWRGNPRNTRGKIKSYQFGTGFVSRIETIQMNFQVYPYDNTDAVMIGDVILNKIEELNALAVNDGFNNWDEMRCFFLNSDGQFFGKIIFWNYAKCVWL